MLWSKIMSDILPLGAGFDATAAGLRRIKPERGAGSTMRLKLPPIPKGAICVLRFSLF